MLGRSADDREQDGEGHDPRANLVGRLVARCDAETPSALENDCTVNTLRAGLSAGQEYCGRSREPSLGGEALLPLGRSISSSVSWPRR
jgi:hypothetical protein